MRLLLLVFFLCSTPGLFAQDEFLAKQYFNDGEFEKALPYYEKLVRQQPLKSEFLDGLVVCYQQLEKYQVVEELLLKRINDGAFHPMIYVDLGQNYLLQDREEEARQYYEKALEYIEQNPNFSYGIGNRFQRYTLLDYAIRAYTRAMEVNPQLNHTMQMARIYGEMGQIEKMYSSYLDLLGMGNARMGNIVRSIDNFVTSDPEHENNTKLRRLLLQRAQKQPDVRWNELLSWLFVKQRQFKLAFAQEKAILKRLEEGSWARLENLGLLALEEGFPDDARAIFTYIEERADNQILKLNARLHLIDLDLLEPSAAVLKKTENAFEVLMETYGFQSESLQLQIAYANFLTFKRDRPGEAISILKKSLKLPLSRISEAYAKLALGDILVFDQKFNEALIIFSQVQKRMKNDVLGQDARFKVAQTSFYKGDFEWALTQLKVLRGSTSQLIANDAMQLSLLISDNSLEDSTQTALKKYARADLLAYQNRTGEAINSLEDILLNHKGEKIEDEALLKQGELLEKVGDHERARFNYQKIVEFYGQDILADDAHFSLGQLYRNIFNEPEKAKQHYEIIIYQYQDSYYYPQAQKLFRQLRGDIIN